MSFIGQFSEGDTIHLGGKTVEVTDVNKPDDAAGFISYKCTIGPGCMICEGKEDNLHSLNEIGLRKNYGGHVE